MCWEQVTQHEALVLTDRPLQRRLQLISLAPHSATGELREPGAVVFTFDQRSQYVAAAQPHDVGGDIPKLDVAPFEHLLKPAHLVRTHVDQLPSVADRFLQLSLGSVPPRPIRTEDREALLS